MDALAADVCVIGAGPAGCVMAARLAQLGLAVCLVERAAFPRRHLGESLSPGVLPLLDVIGARDEIEASGVMRVRSILSNWDGRPAERVDPREQGRLVDRGRFDAALLARARALGVVVLQPAVARERTRAEDAWRLVIETGGIAQRVRARFIVDAGGRTPFLPGRRRRSGPPTVALYAYWEGPQVPEQPRIEVGAHAWFWGVPLPGRVYNTLAFVDGASLRARAASSLEQHFRDLLGESSLMAGCQNARLIGRVAAADATPYLDERSITRTHIKVGDAALAIDPLSSSGVQKAIQTALSGAIVVNTLLKKPELSGAAMRFYRDSLAQASERHRVWATSHYATVAAREVGGILARPLGGAGGGGSVDHFDVAGGDRCATRGQREGSAVCRPRTRGCASSRRRVRRARTCVTPSIPRRAGRVPRWLGARAPRARGADRDDAAASRALVVASRAGGVGPRHCRVDAWARHPGGAARRQRSTLPGGA